MKPLLQASIQLAGALQFVIAAANFFLPSKLQYRENLAKVSPIIRQIFIVHSMYIVLILVGFGGLCLLFPEELVGASTLGRYLCLFFALFWGVRVFLQFSYYDATVKRAHPFGSIFFAGAFLYLAVTFMAASFCSR